MGEVGVRRLTPPTRSSPFSTRCSSTIVVRRLKVSASIRQSAFSIEIVLDGRAWRSTLWVARACQNLGQRVQFSVFEIEASPAQWTKLKAHLEDIIDPELDSLRYYKLGANWTRRIEHVGSKPATDLGGPLIV